MTEDNNSFIGTSALEDLTRAPITDIYQGLKGYFNLAQARFIEDFGHYCSYMYRKSSQVRTLYSRTRPLNLKDVYVQTHFSNWRKERYSDRSIEEDFSSGKRIIIKGNGGSGKTFFVRWLWLQRFQAASGRIPILVELRRISDLATIDIVSFCRSELQADSIFGKGVFEKLCRDGKFEFIFDGFDEVSRASRKSVERQILELSDKYDKCSFLVTGREDDRFSGWGSFEIFDVSPLSEKEVRSLISKIPFDHKVQKRFLENLNKDFYNEYYSFLSNPLLSIMMLMTFHDNAIIPSSLTTFYDHAFQTMLTWHDATKDSFERDRSLSLDNFRKVFSTFCLISYCDQNYEFDEQSLINTINKSLSYHNIDNNAYAVKDDMCESVNLLQKDGLQYAFVHRSFQEYFAAECAVRTISGKARELIGIFAARERDSALEMAYEIHPELVIDEFLAPRFTSLKQAGLFQVADHKSCSKKLGAKFRSNIMGGDLKETRMLKNYLTIESFGDLEAQCDELYSIERMIRLSHGGRIYLKIAREVYEVINTSVKSVFKKTLGEKVRVVINVSITEPDIKISIRNHGEEKVSQEEIRLLRSKINSEIKRGVKKSDKNIKDHLNKSHADITKIVEDRNKKSASVDNILGL